MLTFILLVAFFWILTGFFYKSTKPELSLSKKLLLALLRSISILIVIILMLNPIWTFRTRVSEKPEVIFLIDNSESMNLLVDDISKTQLFDSYVKELADLIENKNYSVKKYYFADGIDGSKNTTNLSKALTDLSSKGLLKNSEKIFLFSDGWLKDNSLDILSRINIPINTLLINYNVEISELSAGNLIYNKTMYKEEENIFIANIESSDFVGKAQVHFEINGDLIEKRDIELLSGQKKDVTFRYSFDETGLYTIGVSVETDRVENLILDNNTIRGAVQVLQSRSLVKIFSDFIDWDAKFLANAVNKNDRRESNFILVRNNQLYKGMENLNIAEVLDSQVHCIVFINHGNLAFNQSQVSFIRQFVENGGGLIHFGFPNEELNEVLPGTISNIRQRFRERIFLTSESSVFRTFNNLDISSIPPVDYYYIDSKIQSQVLARFENIEQSPAIVYGQYGNGKVLFFPILNLWRWQLRDQNANYNSFFENVFSWISNPIHDNFVSVLDKNLFYSGEEVEVKLYAYDENFSINTRINPVIKLSTNGEIVQEKYMSFAENEYRVNFQNLESGNYSFEIISDKLSLSTDGEFIISEEGLEKRDHGFNNPLLTYISNLTEGKSKWAENIDNLELGSAEYSVHYIINEIPLYKKWYIITTFLMAFCGELFLRKKWGQL